jgi:hypothetical protein
MSFTRFHDDPVRIQKQLEESTFLGRYQLNKPGPGTNMPFFEDPSVRLQGWGANLHNNTVEFESELRGLKRTLNRDLLHENNYKNSVTPTYPQSFSNMSPFVEESRATHPAWMYRDLEQSKWETPLLDPQANLEKPFNENVQTRILEKDHFVPSVPIVKEHRDFYLTGNSMCLGGKS